MKITVDMELCQDYGQCVFAAPAVFQLDDNGKLIYESKPGELNRSEVEAAVDVCPMQAILVD